MAYEPNLPVIYVITIVIEIYIITELVITYVITDFH